MSQRRIGIMSLVVLGAFLCLLPSVACSECIVSIGATNYSTVQDAINSVTHPYTQINISGNCYENVFVSELKDYLSLIGINDGINHGAIRALDSGKPVIQTIGKGTRIQNLRISEGLDGIQVIRGGTAFIEDNTIESNTRSGITVSMNSYAHITNNTINRNSDGIVIAENSTARIGVKTRDETQAIAIPNTIEENEYGVTVSISSSALIVGNIINKNTYDGIRVVKASQADISANEISDNKRFGILVTQNSGVNLGRDTGMTGTGIFEVPNRIEVRNGEADLACSIGGYVDGLFNYSRDKVTFTRDCSNSLFRFEGGQRP